MALTQSLGLPNQSDTLSRNEQNRGWRFERKGVFRKPRKSRLCEENKSRRQVMRASYFNIARSR